MSERLVRVDMLRQDGSIVGSGDMYLSLFFYEKGFRQQIVDRQKFCKDGWQGKLDVRVKELTEENIKKSRLKSVVVPKNMFSGYVKTESFVSVDRESVSEETDVYYVK